MKPILLLLLCSLVPCAATLGFYFLKTKTKFGNLSYAKQQIIIGIVFGLVAVFGTEFGVTVNGGTMHTATANIRDTGPLLAGLVFGPEAGIIAGVIGGVERFVATYWGRGEFSQWACSISTVVAGFYAALLRKYIFKKHPSPIICFFCGFVMEVIHLSLLLILKINDLPTALQVLKSLAFSMIFANAFATMLPILILKIIKRKEAAKRKMTISKKLQVYLLIFVTLGYASSTIAIYIANDNTCENEASRLFESSIYDVIEEVGYTVNEHISDATTGIWNQYKTNPTINLHDLAIATNVYEINVVNSDGIIENSSDTSLIGFDMDSGQQSKEFNDIILRAGMNEYIQPYQPMTKDPTQYRKYAARAFVGPDGQNTGYIQVGYDKTSYETYVKSEVWDLPSYRHVGQEGIIIITDSKDKIVTDSTFDKTSFYGKQITDIGIEKGGPKYHKNGFLLKLDGEADPVECHYMYVEVESFYVYTVITDLEIYFTRDLLFYVASFAQIIAYAIIFPLVFLLIDKVVVKNVNSIDESLQAITAGDLSVRIGKQDTVEFSILEKGINQTVSALGNYIEAEKTRNAKELEFAKKIQSSAMPSVFPPFPLEKSFDIYATMITAKEVGGDFYDFFFVAKDKLCFLIADVSGKGIPAAMFMMEGKTMIKNLASTGIHADEIIARANDGLCSSNEAGMFVTCWLGIIDIRTGEVEFANGGHNPPLVFHKDRGWEYLEQKKNLVLGAMEGVPYTLQHLKLEQGDRLFLYTDGVTEAMRGDNALYGEERLKDELNKTQGAELKEVIDGVTKSIADFVQGAPQSDDITMLDIEFKG